MAAPTFDVSIAAHYVPKRIPHLIEVLHAIVDWNRPSVSVTLVTNDPAINDEPLVIEARRRLEARGFTLRIDVTHDMAHPWHLTWWHKQHLRDWFEREAAGEGTPEDLFMYIEDDIVVTRENIAYFTRWLPETRKRGCIPGFLRFETLPDGTVMSPDYRGHQLVRENERLTIGGQAFLSPSHPYWAGFILDRALCAEYLASPWSDLEEADKQPQSVSHTCRVQSAWALTYDTVPQGLHSRYVVPVTERLEPQPECLVWHSANNYTVSQALHFGTVKMKDVFLKPGPVAALRNRKWHFDAFARRARVKLAKELGKMAGR